MDDEYKKYINFTMDGLTSIIQSCYDKKQSCSCYIKLVKLKNNEKCKYYIKYDCKKNIHK